MHPIDQILEIIEKLEAAIRELQRIINATLSVVPEIFSWIIDRVIEGWNALTKKIGEFFSWLGEQLAWIGDPMRLGEAAATWKKDVGGAAAELSRRVDESNLLVDDYWTGIGASQYRQAIGPQREAMESIQSDFAFNIADALESMKWAIITYYVGVLGGFLTIIIGFATATGEAVTVFGIPLAPPTALGALAVGLLAIIGTSINLDNAASGAKNTMASAAAGVQTWPKFVTA